MSPTINLAINSPTFAICFASTLSFTILSISVTAATFALVNIAVTSFSSPIMIMSKKSATRVLSDDVNTSAAACSSSFVTPRYSIMDLI